MTTEQTPAPTPLDLARAWAARVYAIAAHYEQRERDDPGFGDIEAHVHGAGRQQHEAAEMAALMAVVSIAEDLHRIGELLGVADLLDQLGIASTPRGGPGQEGKDQGP
jgi:hypothetical protein